ncbi:MAG: dihydroxy-acid dehydratase [Desulfobacterales bacterium]|nr:dihydroxy-acid dehydratase [Desulfobacterales bacterium]
MKNLRSQKILHRPRWSKVRALFKSMGYSDADLARPLIGIANSWNRIVPGHYNLRRVAEYVTQGILQAGGTPLEFGVIAACDGIATGHEGMHYVLPSREIIAGSIEIMVQAHKLDGIVMLGSCDKIVPGMLMGAARLDVPAIHVVGGPAEGGCEFDGRAADTTSIAEGLGMLKAGRIDEETYNRLEDQVMPTCGSCSFMGTANSMACAAEAMGMSLPGTANIPATHADRLRAAQHSGRQIVELVRSGISSRQIISRLGIENAIRLTAAIGGSTNMALHLPAIGYETGVQISMTNFDELCRTTPHIAKMNPAAAANVADFHLAGGVKAVMSEILPLLHGDAMTVTGKTVAENLVNTPKGDPTVIRTFQNPWSSQGGLAVLRGNLAPDSAITKPAAIHRDMQTFAGQARCFDSEEDANQAIIDGNIQPGNVVVIRYEGPKGGPGMREMATAMKLLYGCGMALKTAVVTDGRFSGTNNGCFVGHISPEAAEGGPIAAVRDGDTITIDIPNRTIRLEVDDEEISTRLAGWQRPVDKITSGYLGLYARLASSAAEGAVLKINSMSDI